MEKKSIVLWLPNFCTTLTCLFGFLAITSSAAGDIEKSCFCVFLAAVTDFLDGRFARMTGNESEFGAAYDSLADIIAFGIAPAIICYHYGLFEFNKIGWSCAFIYATATALRLARFNTSETDPSVFIGMPCPAAALFVVSYVLVINKVHLSLLMLILHLLLASVLQVSNIPFPHTKKVKVPANYRLLLILALVILMCIIFTFPAWSIYGLMLGYIIYSCSCFFIAKE